MPHSFPSGRVFGPHARARAGLLVHLAEQHGHLRVALEVDDARLDHLVIEVVALAGALSDAGEHRIAAVGLGDVVDELLDQHRLANASAAEQTDLAAARVGRPQAVGRASCREKGGPYVEVTVVARTLKN